MGVVVMRQPARSILSQLLRMQERYRHHPWWEQGAAMELFGYDEHPLQATYLASGTTSRTLLMDNVLPLKWNVLFDRTPIKGRPYILHASGADLNTRIAVLAAAMEGDTVWKLASTN